MASVPRREAYQHLHSPSRRRTVIAGRGTEMLRTGLALASTLMLTVAGTAVAQPAAAPAQLQRELISRQELANRSQAPAELDQRSAEETRNELERLMRLYPHALGRVLKLDPTLMANAAYLAPYPALAQFLQRNPEVSRFPA